MIKPLREPYQATALFAEVVPFNLVQPEAVAHGAAATLVQWALSVKMVCLLQDRHQVQPK